jgi:hypothetical protein
MRNYKPILVLILLCLSLGIGHAGTSKQPAEWTLYLKTGGIPFPNTKQFEVNLDYTGKLLITEQNADNQTLKVERNIPSKDAQVIYEQALKTFRDFRFAEENEKRYDGTDVTLRLKVYYRVLEMQLFNVPRLEEENANVTRLISLINKHLPEEHQVY